MIWLTILLVIVALCLAVLGIIGSVLPVLPGPILSYLGIIAMHFAGDGDNFSWPFLIIFGLLSIGATILDYVVPAYATKKFGGTKYGVWGSMAGLIIGLFFPPIGIIIGPLLGAIAGDLIGGKKLQSALVSGAGAFLGFIFGTGLKLILAIIMFGFIIIETFKLIF